MTVVVLNANIYIYIYIYIYITILCHLSLSLNSKLHNGVKMASKRRSFISLIFIINRNALYCLLYKMAPSSPGRGVLYTLLGGYVPLGLLIP